MIVENDFKGRNLVPGFPTLLTMQYPSPITESNKRVEKALLLYMGDAGTLSNCNPIKQLA